MKKEINLKVHDANTIVNLRGISTPSPSIAWVAGEEGTFARTIDGGMSWKCSQIGGAETLFFRSIRAFDENTAYIMSSDEGEAARIYKTYDGGNTWSLQLKGVNQEFFNCLAFWNQDHGMVLSDPIENRFKIYLTENGGTSWLPISQSAMPMALEGEIAFAASGSCMATYGNMNAWFGTGGKAARVFRTTDGGGSWTVANTPIMHDTDSAGIFSIAFDNAQDGVISGGDFNTPNRGGSNLALTHDGGLTWTQIEISPQYYWSAVSFTSDHEHIVLVGSTNAGYTTTKSTSIWKKTWDDNLNALSLWSGNKFLAVGPKGRIIEVDFEAPIQSFNDVLVDRETTTLKIEANTSNPALNEKHTKVGANHTIAQEKIAQLSPKVSTINQSNPLTNLSMQILAGFITVIGCAAVAIAFTLLHAATFGISGLLLAGLGITATLLGFGLFAVKVNNNKQELKGSGIMPPMFCL